MPRFVILLICCLSSLNSLGFSDGLIISFEEETAETKTPQEKSPTVSPQDSGQKPSDPVDQSQQIKSQASDHTEESKTTNPEHNSSLSDEISNDQQSLSTDSYEKTFMRTLLLLIALLSLILIGVWLMRKFSGGKIRHLNSGKTIKILERRPISHKSMLYLIDIRGRQFLIAESQLEVSKISALDWLDEEKPL